MSKNSIKDTIKKVENIFVPLLLSICFYISPIQDVQFNDLEFKFLYTEGLKPQDKLYFDRQSQISVLINIFETIITYILLIIIRIVKPKIASDCQNLNLYYKTDKQKKLLKLISFECDKCNINVPNSIHSGYSKICLYDYNHMCPWVGKDIYLLNFLPFYVLCLMLFWISLVDIQNSFKFYKMYYNKLCELSQIPQEISGKKFCINIFTFIAVVFTNNDNKHLYQNILFLLDMLVCIPSFAQLLYQIPNLFYIYNYDQRSITRSLIKPIKKNQYRIIMNEDDDIDVYQIQDQDIQYLQSNGLKKTDEFQLKGKNQKIFRVLSKKQSLKFLKKEMNKRSIWKLIEIIKASKYFI